MSNKFMIFESNKKKVEFCHSALKGHAWKESDVTTQGTREVEVAILLLKNDKNVTAENLFKLFLVFKLQVWSIGRTFQD